MTAPTGGLIGQIARDSARQRALEMERSLQHTQRDEQETIVLLEKLDKLAVALFDHARDWDEVNPEAARRVRLQEQQAHDIRSKVRQLAAMEADEASLIMDEIRKALDTVRGD